MGGVEVISVFVGHRRRGEWGSLAGRPGGAALRGSLVAQPVLTPVPTWVALIAVWWRRLVLTPVLTVGCIDCRIDAGRCVHVEVCWFDICGDAPDAAIDDGCSEGCIIAGCTDAYVDVGGIDGCIVVGRTNVLMLVAFMICIVCIDVSEVTSSIYDTWAKE